MSVLLIITGIILILLAVMLISEGFIPVALFLFMGIVNIIGAVQLRKYKNQRPQQEIVVERKPPKQPSDTRKQVDTMSGIEFEQFCMRVMEGYGFVNIQQTPASGDHGVDILAWKGGKKYAIQCKRYKQNVGNKAVQEVYTGKQLYAAGEAIVLTSSYFTAQAKQEADDLGVTLWDRDGLKHIMDMTGINDVTL